MWCTVSELAGCAGMPGTERGCRKYLDNLSAKKPDIRRKKAGTKAFEYHIDFLPLATQEEIKSRYYSRILESKTTHISTGFVSKSVRTSTRQEVDILRNCPALLDREVSSLTDKQKQIADARAALAMEVEKLRDAGMSRSAAVKYVATASRNGSLPEHLRSLAEIANARKGSRTGIGERSLQEWLTVFLTTKPGVERMAMLAPGYLKAEKPEQISWLPQFLAHWRNLNGPSLSAAYRDFCEEWSVTYADQPGMLSACPSYDAIRRAMAKLPKRERAGGRVSGSAKLAYETYQKRDWSQMPVNGCWIADGKSLDMKVAHPIHGKPFTPELTLVLDGRTRFCVGWSLTLSENMIAVADAYRYAMQRYGKPLFVYSDNGGGEANKALDADITGILPRMGIVHPTSIPGRPQSRGIIERLNAVIPRRIAQKFDTYNGFGADREHVRMTSRAIQSAVRASENGRELTPVQRNALAKLPSWQQLLDVIEEEVNRYNEQHRHTELPKRNGVHMTPAEYRRAVLASEGDETEYLTDIELRELFMPEEIRKAQRGWVELMNNQYFSEELIRVDSENVRVAFDIHNPSEVIIRRMDGTYVCTAIWNGNKRAAIPVSAMERATEQRRQRRLKRLDEQREEVESEARGLLPGESFPDLGSFIPAEYTTEREEEPYFFLETDRDEYLKKTGNTR